jgi:hypothetical protein
MMNPETKAKHAAAAQYIVDCMKSGQPVTKQDLRFLNTWLSIQKAEAAIAAGKPMPRAFNAGRRKVIPTGRGK